MGDLRKRVGVLSSSSLKAITRHLINFLIGGINQGDVIDE